MATTAEQTSNDQPPDIVRRPDGQLHDFPIEFRWEITRRHPYYLTFWEEVRRYRQGQPDDPPERKLFGLAALVILSAIGVTGEPVSPITPFAELIEDCDPGFLGGAVQPMTLRSMVFTLLAAMPAEDRNFVGNLLLLSAMPDQNDGSGPSEHVDWRIVASAILDQKPSAVLDSFPVAPLFYIHLGASQRVIVRDMEDQVRRWKFRRGIESSKVHTAKVAEYLKVWDLREGWTGAGYDRSRERPFDKIAKQFKKPLSTVASRYRMAFEFIVGQEYVPDVWWRVFGPMKFSRLFGNAKEVYSAKTRHNLQSPVHRPVPESVINPTSNATRKDTDRGSTVIERRSAVKHDFKYRDLLLDLKDLIARGLPDVEIARRLEIADPKAVAEFRRKWEELQQVPQ